MRNGVEPFPTYAGFLLQYRKYSIRILACLYIYIWLSSFQMTRLLYEQSQSPVSAEVLHLSGGLIISFALPYPIRSLRLHEPVINRSGKPVNQDVSAPLVFKVQSEEQWTSFMFGFFSNQRNFSLPSIYTGLGIINSDMIFKDFLIWHIFVQRKKRANALFSKNYSLIQIWKNVIHIGSAPYQLLSTSLCLE